MGGGKEWESDVAKEISSTSNCPARFMRAAGYSGNCFLVA